MCNTGRHGNKEGALEVAMSILAIWCETRGTQEHVPELIDEGDATCCGVSVDSRLRYCDELGWTPPPCVMGACDVARTKGYD